jgi:unsaturated rhamnogalacturonyl hydrolase
MRNSIVKRIVEQGWRGVNTGGKHSGLLNAMYTAGLRSWFDEKVQEVLAGPVITHPNLADSSSRLRPLVLAGKIAQAKAANEIFHKERVVSGGVTQHTTARSTPGWVFADTAYMVPPSQAILGHWELAFADLKGLHAILSQPDGLMRHVFNASIPKEESYVDIDLWIDGTAWGRANGWWMAGVVDSLEVIPQASWDRELVAMYEKTAARLIECQDDGIWHATIDDSYSLIDTSATVQIGYALAKGAQLGIGNERAEQASFIALEAVMRHHFDWRNAILRNQQYGPMIVNSPSPNPRNHDHGNAYGLGFLAALYALNAEGVRVRDLEVQSLRKN